MQRRYLKGLQYFDRDLVTLREGDVVINGGVHDGFEIPVFLALVGTTGKVICVDPNGFDYLSDYVRENVAYFPNATVEKRLAMWSETGTVILYTNDGEQVCGREAKADMPGFEEREFSAATIDWLVSEERLEKVDFIKLDLEGAEPQAIAGMSRTLQSFRPQLAISIYHSINHFWEIPIYLMEHCINYAFFIRSYSSQMHETILYAIPRERLKSGR